MPEMPTEPAVEVRDLRKSYEAVEAVRGIDLRVERGQVFALLGPNGAGKTTTVEILEGHRQRDDGEVRVLGHDPAVNGRGLKERVGIVLQQTGVDEYLTVREVVEMVAGYYPHPRSAAEVLELAGLTEQADRRIKKLSGGQRRRVDFAVALVGNPELLFLDEPTTGFDPSARRQAWETLRGLSGGGTTIFLTTHFMDEAQALADRLAIIAGGRIVAEGSADELIRRAGRGTRVRFALDDGAAPPSELAATRAAGATRWEIVTPEPTAMLYRLTGWAVGQDLELLDLEVVRDSLEDVYLAMTGHTGAEDEDDA
jgi:ABC-2 type transport system ATP-binding protein